MGNGTKKDKNPGLPTERQDTAAWANREITVPGSGVTIPSEEQVLKAKEYVEKNQK